MDFGEMFVDTKDVLEKIDELNLCSFFLETRKRAKSRSAMSWLQICDDDTIKMIRQYSEKIMKCEENPLDNKDKDVFDNPHFKPSDDKFKDKYEDEECEDDEDEDIADDHCDYYSLVCLLLAWEHDNRKVPMDIVDEGFLALSLYANMEEMRRKGLVNINGSGTLLSKNTKFTLTNKGKKFGNTLTKAIHEARKEKQKR